MLAQAALDLIEENMSVGVVKVPQSYTCEFFFPLY